MKKLEIFFIQLKNHQEKNKLSKLKSPVIDDAPDKALEFKKRFPFKFTGAQENAIETIFKDFRNETLRPILFQPAFLYSFFQFRSTINKASFTVIFFPNSIS